VEEKIRRIARGRLRGKRKKRTYIFGMKAAKGGIPESVRSRRVKVVVFAG